MRLYLHFYRQGFAQSLTRHPHLPCLRRDNKQPYTLQTNLFYRDVFPHLIRLLRICFLPVWSYFKLKLPLLSE